MIVFSFGTPYHLFVLFASPVRYDQNRVTTASEPAVSGRDIISRQPLPPHPPAPPLLTPSGRRLTDVMPAGPFPVRMVAAVD